MKSSSLLVVLALAAAVSAQSAPDFPVQVDTELAVDFQSSSTSFIDPGQEMSLDDVQDAPTVSGPQGSTRTLTYMLFMVDQDVKSDDGTRVQLLHFFQPNLAGASEVLSDFSTDADNATTAGTVEYIAPSPPAGDGPHRYTLLLYRQFEDFSIPDEFSSFFPPANTQARIGFDMAGFAKAANLPAPVGANWFQVQNGEAAPSSTTSSETSGSTTVTETTSTSSTETVVTTSSETTASTTATETASTSGTEIVTITTSSSTETAEATATATATATGGSSQATSSSSETASATSAGSNAASSVDVRNSLTGLIVGLSLSIVGMWF
ncbi:hypothetical protein PV05_00807 [Exophiala xenobiotica]|uniref:PEBP-like protein n=1 Tax=Exophiala xenobiotica TaxID=348802 RepID=A0A0D2C6T9_9EURO|nr:uncharacterized protein PV05_00807 [Exophiala xenobiotica]KIW60601.1 hypothetical protein PV05_00807 [Exophiala xenobiotica]